MANIAERKLVQLDAAQTLEFLRSPPGNRLERLKGERKGQYSIRVNDQFRVCFRWTKEGPEDGDCGLPLRIISDVQESYAAGASG